MSTISEIVKRVEKRLDEISRMKDKVYIVNAGTTNNGKSSTFNSLLMLEGRCKPGQNVFKVQDVRTTVENQEALYRDGVYLLDTPGLEATESDDEVALKGYANASLIVFVHALKKGELHESELKWIQKITGLLTNSYFSKHFCLVLTHREDDLNDEKKQLSTIKAVITKQLQEYCQLSGIPMFCISNSLLEKGIAGKKESLKKASQVAELKAYVDKKLAAYRTEQRFNIERMVKQAKEEALKELQNKSKEAKKKQLASRERGDSQYAAFKADVESVANEIDAARAERDRKNAAYQNAKNLADSLERKWRANRW